MLKSSYSIYIIMYEIKVEALTHHASECVQIDVI